MSEEEQAAPPGDAELGPGAMLARARAERKLGVAEVAERLKYGARQIDALEADDYSRLPGNTFVRGMIRGYAKLVGLDPVPVLKALERRNIPAQATVDLRPQRIPFLEGNKRGRGTRLYMVLSVVALLGIVAVLYEWHMVDDAAAPAPVSVMSPVIKPEAAPTAPAPGAPEPVAMTASVQEALAAPAPVAVVGTSARRGNAGRIQLDFQQESWVEIKDRAGRTLLSQLNSAGTQRVVQGAPPFSVTIGNAASVRLQYNDAPVDLKPYVKVEVARLTLE